MGRLAMVFSCRGCMGQAADASLRPDRSNVADHSARNQAASTRVAASVRSGGVASCRKPAHRFVQRQHLLAAPPSRRSATVPLLRLLAADHRQHRHVGQAVVAHLGVDLLVGQVGLHRQPGRARAPPPPPARRRRRRRRSLPPPPAPAPARAGSARRSARSGCRGTARSCPGWRGAASPGVRRLPSSATYSASSRSGRMKSTCSVPHCQSRPIASRSTNSSFGP